MGGKVMVAKKGTKNPSNQDRVIEMLVRRGFAADGETFSQAYKIVTQQSYPLAGGLVTTGGKPRFRKGKWKVGVGKITTTIYRKPDHPETVTGQGRMAGRRLMTFRDWETYNIPTKEVELIRDKLQSLGL